MTLKFREQNPFKYKQFLMLNIKFSKVIKKINIIKQIVSFFKAKIVKVYIWKWKMKQTIIKPVAKILIKV